MQLLKPGCGDRWLHTCTFKFLCYQTKTKISSAASLTHKITHQTILVCLSAQNESELDVKEFCVRLPSDFFQQCDISVKVQCVGFGGF